MVANQATHGALVTWALQAGFPVDNILSTKASGPTSVASDVGFAVRAAGLEDRHLVVASLDVMYQPRFNLQRVVEHSLVRAKDTVLVVRPPPGQSVSGGICVELADMSLGAANPQVVGVDTAPQGLADGISAVALAPVVVVRRTSLQDFLSGPAGEPSSSHARQIGALVQDALLGSGKPVYALEEDLCLDVSTAGGAALADAFYSARLKAEAAASEEAQGAAAQGLAEVTKAAQDLNIMPRGDEAMQALIEASSDVKKAFLEFYASGAAAASASTSAGAAAAVGEHAMPARFADPTLRKHTPKKQNPMYATSNNNYGFRAPEAVHMPDVYSGASTQFSGKFYGGPSKVSSMVTSITRSNVHKALDDF